uniref:C2H2-type domain-containing protein n=1 Tax=Bubo bubo TaxID=30461 RepID=A0A8C0EF69_BUBBB
MESVCCLSSQQGNHHPSPCLGPPRPLVLFCPPHPCGGRGDQSSGWGSGALKVKAQDGTNRQGHAGCEKEEKGREGAEQAETWSRWLLFMCLKSPQLSPFGLPTGAGTDKQKEEQCQPREEQRGMLQGPEEEPQSPTVDVEHDGQQQPDDTQGSHGPRTPRKCSFKGTYAEDCQEDPTQLRSRCRGKEYKCEHCGKVFGWQGSLTRHQWIHTGEKPFKCPDCGKSFRDSWRLLSHRRGHTEEKPFLCTTCGKRFSCSSNLIRHQLIHTGERPYTCSDCGKTFRSNLIRHQLIHTGERPYTCSDCGKTFRQSYQLRRHQKAPREEQRGMLQGPEEEPQSPTVDVEHDGQQQPDGTQGSHGPRRPQKCSFKGMCGEDPQEDTSQPRCRSRQKVYKCMDCEKVFIWQDGLSRHQRTHTGEKPFKCQDCGKSFTESGNLLCHQRTHTKEKPFLCTTCGKRFSWRSNLMKHLRIHTGERPYACSHCGKTFQRRAHVRRHQEALHNGESLGGGFLSQFW